MAAMKPSIAATLGPGLVYLATPYTRYPAGIHAAFADAARLAAALMIAGVKVYSPIAHTHPLAIHGGLDPRDLTIWLPFDEALMAKADALCVAHLDGWDTSTGIAHEVRFFEAAGKPVFDLDPETLAVSGRGER